MTNIYEDQAQYWNNYHFINRSVRACVHLENENDKMFWDEMLQKHRPGNYHYIAYSKSESGYETSGVEQCLHFIPYINKNFFICIDSDYRFLLKDSNTNRKLLQTYTYSWESHYVEKKNLALRLNSKNISFADFDFTKFLSNYSRIIYKPLLILLYSKGRNDREINEKEFNQCLTKQCNRKELRNSGELLVKKTKDKFDKLLKLHSNYIDNIDIKEQENKYKSRGLDASNAYLHIRGHNIYDLVKFNWHIIDKRNKHKF